MDQGSSNALLGWLELNPDSHGLIANVGHQVHLVQMENVLKSCEIW